MKNIPFPVHTIPPKAKSNETSLEAPSYANKIYKEYFNTPIKKARLALEKTSPEEWDKRGQQQALKVFHAAAERVPAYMDILKKHKVDHKDIKTFEDFKRLPVIDKDSYLKKYPVEHLCWDGVFSKGDIVSVSSGSSGQPFLWPRDIGLEMEVTYFFEVVLDSFFHISSRKTLLVDCFAMGMYVGGPFVLNTSMRIAQKGYPFSVVTPGNIMEDILRVVKEIGRQYEQVIFSGYPPFIKDVIENGRKAGIDFNSFKTVIFPAGEGFSEAWRNAIAENASIEDPVTSLLGYYGTADAAVMGTETPWSVILRKAVSQKPANFEKVFGECRMPSVLQYIPTLRYFELINQELVFTAANGCIPLIRYNIRDKGGLWSFDDAHKHLEKIDVSYKDELTRNAQYGSPWKIPFVYVFGRSDHTAIIYGANVYPENIKSIVETKELGGYCTGRFVLDTEEDHTHNQHLILHLECHNHVKKTDDLRDYITKTVFKMLKEINAEYANTARANGDKTIPRIFLQEYEDPRYFPRQQKQPWRLKK
jgi:phenylacetate-CoA ligase